MAEELSIVEGRKVDEKDEPKRNVLPIIINEAKLVLVTEACCVCGIVFAFPESYQRQRKSDMKNFYCPNGHHQYYPPANRNL